MNEEGYSFDAATHEHVFRYREHVPGWWGLFPKDNQVRLMAAAACAMIGYLIGSILGDFGGYILGALGFFQGYFKLAPYVERFAPVKLTGTRNSKHGGRVTDFLVEWRSRDDGLTTLYREYWHAKAKRGEYTPQALALAGIASIERVRFPDLYPDTVAHMIETKDKDLADARAAEMVMVYFRDGQSIEAGWQQGANSASRVQSGLIGYIDNLGTHINAQQVAAERLASMAPGDAPL